MTTPDSATAASPPDTRRRRPAVFAAVAAACVLGNTVNGRLGLARANTEDYIVGILPFLLLAGATWMILSLGLRKTCFALAPAAALLLAAEIVARAAVAWVLSPSQGAFLGGAETGGSDRRIYAPHHYAVYIGTPGLSLPDGLRHNSLGLRDAREFGPDPSARRIVFIGGSTTYTVGIRDNDRIFTAGLESRLNEHFGTDPAGPHFEVINAGLGGSVSAENLVRLAFFVSEVSPDLVVIQHGINDAKVRACGEIATDFSNYRTRWRPPPFLGTTEPVAAAATRNILRRSLLLDALMIRVGLTDPPRIENYAVVDGERNLDASRLAENTPRYFERNTRSMIALARSFGAEAALATCPVTDAAADFRLAAVPEHNALLRRLAEEEGTLFFDFAAKMTKDAEHMPDGRHVSQKGSDLKRDLYFRWLVDSGAAARLLAADTDTERN